MALVVVEGSNKSKFKKLAMIGDRMLCDREGKGKEHKAPEYFN